MKRNAFILTSLLVLSFGLANAQVASVTATLTSGGFGTDTIATGVPAVWTIHVTNTSGNDAGGVTNGFRLYSAGTWGAGLVLDTLPMPGGWDSMFDLIVSINPFSITGSGADTVGLGGASIGGTGYFDGFDADVATLTATFDHGQDGVQACLDSSYYPPGGVWLWSTFGGNVFPDWNGPLCYTLYKVPNEPPECAGGDGNLGVLDHCVLASANVTFTDPEGDAIIAVNQLSGLGTTVDNGGGSATWSYAPSLADVGASIPTVEIEACDAFGCSFPNKLCVLDMSFVNAAPTITCPAAAAVGKGNTVCVAVTGDQVDCDPITYSKGTVSPTPVGTITVDPSTGEVCFATDEADAGTEGQTFNIEVIVSDGNASASCNVVIDVLFTEPFGAGIGTSSNTIQGGHELVDISVGSLAAARAGSEGVGGFDFLISYDASALTFVGAAEGSIYARCGWEYFSYRYGANGNCQGGCPSGLLRVVGIAETNNGPYHPDCFLMNEGESFVTLDFLVSSDVTLECQFVPLRFYWMDCGDNTLSSQTGDSLFISRAVIDASSGLDFSNPSVGYPTYQGAQDSDCFDPGQTQVPVRFVDFFNGGLQIACLGENNGRGDINLNSVKNEIGDAVLFSNYFVQGMGVFIVAPASQIAATDVNADGLTLTVADLVYLIRVIVGDAMPYPKVSPIAATYSHDNNMLRVNSEMGAVYVVVEGNSVPTLMADNMEMRSNYDGSNTRILVYSMEEGASFSGEFLQVVGDIVSIEMATYEGAPVVASKALPTAFSLQQNYPNPFNPTTRIGFKSPVAGEYELSIYNVAGQKITSFSGISVAGENWVEWDARDAASGIYFYKLDTQNFSATKKMVLLK